MSFVEVSTECHDIVYYIFSHRAELDFSSVITDGQYVSLSDVLFLQVLHAHTRVTTISFVSLGHLLWQSKRDKNIKCKISSSNETFDSVSTISSTQSFKSTKLPQLSFKSLKVLSSQSFKSTKVLSTQSFKSTKVTSFKKVKDRANSRFQKYKGHKFQKVKGHNSKFQKYKGEFQKWRGTNSYKKCKGLTK